MPRFRLTIKIFHSEYGEWSTTEEVSTDNIAGVKDSDAVNGVAWPDWAKARDDDNLLKIQSLSFNVERLPGRKVVVKRG